MVSFGTEKAVEIIKSCEARYMSEIDPKLVDLRISRLCINCRGRAISSPFLWLNADTYLPRQCVLLRDAGR